MIKVIFFVLPMLLPFIGFPQFDFKFRDSDSNAINNTIKKAYYGHADVFIGTFMPNQKAKLIGVKPAVGLSIGLQYERMTYDLTMELRFGKTKNKYQLANSDMTNHYFGGYFGIEIMRDIWTNKKNQILLFGGTGVDLFVIVPAEYRNPNFLEYILFEDDEILIKEDRSIYSANFNFGLMYRFYHKEKNYFGVKYRYNFVDYNSDKILTDITGNYHSVMLSFGYVSKN